MLRGVVRHLEGVTNQRLAPRARLDLLAEVLRVFVKVRELLQDLAPRIRLASPPRMIERVLGSAAVASPAWALTSSTNERAG